jgi:thiamine kinase-like enzyme
MSEGVLQNILRLVSEARAIGSDEYQAGGWRVLRIRGGMNNALYRVDSGEASFACKLCVSDERRRVEREYAALELLHKRSVDIAPKPVGIDRSGSSVIYPAVVYEWVEGSPMNPERNDSHLHILLNSVQSMHACRPERDDRRRLRIPVQKAWFHWFGRAPYINELNEFMEKYAPWLRRISNEGQALSKRLERLARIAGERLEAMPVALECETLPLCFCHVDPNSNNIILRADGQVRWVDWEYSGWGDPALDLAEYRWHMAYVGLSASQQAWFREAYQIPADDASFYQRLAFWDALLAVRWPLLMLRWLWSREHGPDRMRLTTVEAEKTDLWGRLVWLLERAELFYAERWRI